MSRREASPASAVDAPPLDEHTTTRVDVGDRLRAVFSIDPAAPAALFADTWWSWDDLSSIADQIATAVADAGLAPSVPVAVVARNRPGVLGAIAGCLVARRAYASINPMLPDGPFVDDIATVNSAVLIGCRHDLERRGVGDVARREGMLTVGLPEGPSDRCAVLLPLGHPASPRYDPGGDVAVSLTTSGTTGEAKRVTITTAALSAMVAGSQRHAGSDLTPATRLASGAAVICTPLSHISGLFRWLNAFTVGRRVALMERFEPREWARLVSDLGVKVGALPPAAIRMLVQADIGRETLANLTHFSAGSAPMDPALEEEVEARFGVPVLQGYGATEFGGITSFTLDDHRRWGSAKRGTVGRAHPGVQLRVVDADTGASLPAGARGVLEVRGVQSGASSPAEWVRTNDLASLDEDGFLYIHGRVDDVMIRGGFKVDLNAVENCLRAHPAVKDVAVAALDDDRLGQVPGALIVAAGARPSEDELRSWVRERMAPYAVPAVIRIVDAIPRNPALKPVRPAVVGLLTGADTRS